MCVCVSIQGSGLDQLGTDEDGYGKIMWLDATVQPVFSMRPTAVHKKSHLVVASLRVPGLTCKVRYTDTHGYTQEREAGID